MFPFIIPALCAAVGAAAGAIAAHSSGEKDRQKAKHLNQVNNDLINKRNDLEKRYHQLSDRSKQEINDYQRKLVNSELEKDALYLAIRLQNDLMSLMEALDRNPSLEVIEKFQDAVVKTNWVLKELGENLVPISQNYFDRAQEKVLTEKQQFILKEQSNLAINEMSFHARQKAAIDEMLSTTLVSHVEKKTNSTIGTITCPYCHQQNEVMQKTPSIKCNTCYGFIDLVARHREIKWNQIKPSEEKLNSASDGSIACPLCRKSNPVTKGMASLNCNSCDAFINLTVKHYEIQWHPAASISEVSSQVAHNENIISSPEYEHNKSINKESNTEKIRKNLQLGDRFKDSRNWFEQARNFHELGQYEQAIDCYDRAIQIDSEYKLAWDYRSIALEKLDSFCQKEQGRANEIFDIVKGLIAAQLEVDFSKIKPSSSFEDDLGADSLDIIELVMAFEEEFDLEILDEEIQSITRVEDILKYLNI